MPEFSERGRYVTTQVALWLANDGQRNDAVRQVIELEGMEGLIKWVRKVVSRAREGDAAWHVAQELAPNDFSRIDWAEVIREVMD